MQARVPRIESGTRRPAGHQRLLEPLHRDDMRFKSEISPLWGLENGAVVGLSLRLFTITPLCGFRRAVRNCGPYSSDPFAGAELHLDVERHAHVLLGVGVHVVHDRLRVGVARPRGGPAATRTHNGRLW